MSTAPLTWHLSPANVLVAKIDRPRARHAINFDVMDGLEELLPAAAKATVLLITATGDHFVSGGDLKAFHHLTSADDARDMAIRMKTILQRIEDLPTLSITAINGDAYGGGCELALATDLRFLKKGAHLTFSQGRFHLPPGWGGLTRLVERVGSSKALFWLASQHRISHSEALSTGLVDQVLDADAFHQTALDLAERIATTRPHLLQILKEGVGKVSSHTRNESLQAELSPFLQQWVSPEHLQAVDDFLNKK